MIYIILIAIWLWFCLVMFNNNHMRNALFCPVLIPIGILFVFLEWMAQRYYQFILWFAKIGHGDK